MCCRTKNVELVPRVGDHIIYLGKLDGFERKLERMKAFYEKGLNQVGWNKYLPALSVEFSNQIICYKARELMYDLTMSDVRLISDVPIH